MDPYKSIKNWASEDRPREKMIAKGAAALSNAELLAILINTGISNKSALDIAKEIMEMNHQNLLELSKMTFSDLKKIKGLGEKKAITLLTALEIGKRRQLSAALEKPQIRSSQDAFALLVPLYFGKSVEAFYVIFMLHNGKVLSIENVSNGGITGTVVDSRVIFKRALELKAVTRLVLSHNHPSGNLNPSEADKRLTDKMIEGGKLLDIEISDHIIVGANAYFSFKDEGLM
ncbi:MAG: DNA repair protein RadC [Bacteroidetes bacterium]|jgi:DNA repair protein RadC|nr:DNA repair protein RadC [Bacteroidota bacterium]HMT35742.1 DNA repair protein RadC [Chitinophagaceae bacterium]MBK6818457.1 DNA repair protein RadC [Bacteroidota bacterium]MBK7040739.1 DNA repair protein RadC [Bacteroidota bacterium]MBK8328550.1 DNA repair protein RadC [Bacteroidota bacterium]